MSSRQLGSRTFKSHKSVCKNLYLERLKSFERPYEGISKDVYCSTGNRRRGRNRWLEEAANDSFEGLTGEPPKDMLLRSRRY